MAAICAALLLGACDLTRPPSRQCVLPGAALAQAGLASSGRDAGGATLAADPGPMVLDALRDRAAEAPARQPITFQVLSLSAGGQYGALGAGFLRGWAENPVNPRPDFDLVTGVSAGAFLAPAVFAGQGRDGALDIYDGLSEAEVFRRRPLPALLSAPSLSSVEPLEGLLRQQLDAQTIAAIAARHRDGARLLISAVNLDTTRQTVFDLGAIAASGLPLEHRRDCMAEAMLASGAIPGLFPPRAIDGALFADGGLREQVFLAAIEESRRRVAAETGREIRVEAVVVVNGALRPPVGPVADRLPDYIGRSVAILADEVLRDSIAETVAFAAARPDWTLRGIVSQATLERCGGAVPVGTFDPCVTSALFAEGRARGRAVPLDLLSAGELRALADAL
ncbi:patatin-like phospholipase family protein [Oceaniovalibus guishaninsula]|nr:patatin-like phospholipase family protein [Oceaniovalibus guishaninsula]